MHHLPVWLLNNIKSTLYISIPIVYVPSSGVSFITSPPSCVVSVSFLGVNDTGGEGSNNPSPTDYNSKYWSQHYILPNLFQLFSVFLCW
jgi:hypothetical protein